MTAEIKKKPTEYALIACDLDGTLYDQPRLRAMMAFRLLRYYLCHPHKVRDLLIIKYYREIRESWDEIAPKAENKCQCESLDEVQYAYVASKYGRDSEYVREVIDKWMHTNPLDAVKATADGKLVSLLQRFRNKGQKLVIFSDYPIEEKIKAIGLEADGYYSADNERINELKPSPKGLNLIMSDYEVTPGEVLVIGDRDSKDGECARRAGADYIIVERNVKKRDYSIFC